MKGDEENENGKSKNSENDAKKNGWIKVTYAQFIEVDMDTEKYAGDNMNDCPRDPVFWMIFSDGHFDGSKQNELMGRGAKNKGHHFLGVSRIKTGAAATPVLVVLEIWFDEVMKSIPGICWFDRNFC